MSQQNQPYQNQQKKSETDGNNDVARGESYLRRFRLPLGLLGVLIFLIIIMSYRLWPDWPDQPGGWLLLPVAGAVGAVTFLSALVSYLNDWEEIRRRRQNPQDAVPVRPLDTSIVQTAEDSENVKQTVRSKGSPAGHLWQGTKRSEDVEQNIDLR